MQPSRRRVPETARSVLEALRWEALSNACLYTHVYSSFESYENYMSAYVYHKQYDSLFGDIVPNIISNALKITFIIISKTDNDVFRVNEISPRTNSPIGYAIVYKDGMHYDGVIQQQNDESYCFPMESVNQWESIYRAESYGYANCISTDELSSSINLQFYDRNNDNVNNEPMSSRNRNTLAERKLVNIISWNINGLTPDKLNKNVLGSFLEDYDIILLCETWASEQDDFTLEGFKYYNYPRKYKHHAAKRNSGGLGVFIRNELQNGVTIWTNTDDVIAWIILKRSFFGFENDIYVANVYIVPEGSTYLKYDEFSLFYDQILKVPDGCGILLCGDYNARTGVMWDFNVNFTGSNGDLDHLLPHFETLISQIKCHLINLPELLKTT